MCGDLQGECTQVSRGGQAPKEATAASRREFASVTRHAPMAEVGTKLRERRDTERAKVKRARARQC